MKETDICRGTVWRRTPTGPVLPRTTPHSPPTLSTSLGRALTWVQPTLWFGRPMSAASRAAFSPGHCLVGPHLVYVSAGALYVSFLRQMDLFWMCNAAMMFCVSLLCLLCVFMLFPTCVLVNQESPKLVEFVSDNSYHYC